MKKTQWLTEEQEAIRLEGLRVLARLIARRLMAEAAREPGGEEERPADDETRAARKDGTA